MHRITKGSKNVLLLLGICVFFIGKSIVAGELASEPSEYRIGFWRLQFANRTNGITYANITNIVGISSNLMVSLRDGVTDVHIDGVVVDVKSGQQTTCDVFSDNNMTRYKLSCIEAKEQQLPFATVIVTYRVDEYINKAEFKGGTGGEGLRITPDGQLAILPGLGDKQNKTDNYSLIAIIKDQGRRSKDKDVRSNNPPAEK
ncbi:hypothetical protein ACFLQL_00915 [Verrucomicrobiota bacterium]